MIANENFLGQNVGPLEGRKVTGLFNKFLAIYCFASSKLLPFCSAISKMATSWIPANF